MTQKTQIVSAVFNPKTCSFTVTTPKGVFENVLSVGGFDNYRDMDYYLADYDLKPNGVIAYLFDAPETVFIFHYPDGGDITVKREN